MCFFTCDWHRPLLLLARQLVISTLGMKPCDGTWGPGQWTSTCPTHVYGFHVGYLLCEAPLVRSWPPPSQAVTGSWANRLQMEGGQAWQTLAQDLGWCRCSVAYMLCDLEQTFPSLGLSFLN